MLLPDGVSARGGVQPVLSLTVNGAPVATVRAGKTVTVRVDAEAWGRGVIVDVLADLAGSGSLADALIVEPANRVTVEQAKEFSEPGTSFIAARVTAQVEGDASASHARVQNIARARVMVGPKS